MIISSSCPCLYLLMHLSFVYENNNNDNNNMLVCCLLLSQISQVNCAVVGH